MREDPAAMQNILSFICKLLSGLVLLLLVACDDEEVDQRQMSKWNSSDLEVQVGPDLLVYLPDRSQLQATNPDVIDLINSFYLKITPEGQRCQDQKTIEILDAYRDNEAIEFRTLRFCDYRLEFMVGHTDPKKIANSGAQKQLNSAVNYVDNIQPILQEHCLSCHPNYLSYRELMPYFAELVFQVENNLMPPTQPLAQADIARFLVWQANDFAETNPQDPDADSLLANISQVYYRNNLNTVVFEYMLLNRNYFAYEDSLWLQPDGEAIGIQTLELLILEPVQKKY